MRILIHFYILVTNEPKPNVQIVLYTVDVIQMGSEKCYIKRER